MKAFIFIALVAAVAARGVDIDRIVRERADPIFRQPIANELVKDQLVQRVPLEKTLVGDVATTERVVPVEKQQLPLNEQEQEHRQVLKGIYDVDRVFTIEELYTTELFREYLAIPLFRQYMQYPMFQRYVASVYFQRFWQIPTFRQYFLNPVLFYKYVYPIVQLFQNEYNFPIQTVYGQKAQDIFGRQYPEEWIVKNRNVLPYVYGQQNEYNRYPYYGYPIYAGQYYPFAGQQGVNYKFLLDKIYKELVAPVEGVKAKTDIKVVVPEVEKVQPIVERQVVEEPKKVVDVKVAETILPVEEQRQVVDKIAERQYVRDDIYRDLVKEQYQYGYPEVYQTINEIPSYQREGRQYYNIPEYQREERQYYNIPEYQREGRQYYEVPEYQREGRQYYEVPEYQREARQYYNIPTPFVPRREQDIYTPYMNRLVQGDRVNYFNKYNNYNGVYNTEVPYFRENTVYNRVPFQFQQVARNVVA